MSASISLTESSRAYHPNNEGERSLDFHPSYAQTKLELSYIWNGSSLCWRTVGILQEREPKVMCVPHILFEAALPVCNLPSR